MGTLCSKFWPQQSISFILYQSFSPLQLSLPDILYIYHLSLWHQSNAVNPIRQYSITPARETRYTFSFCQNHYWLNAEGLERASRNPRVSGFLSQDKSLDKTLILEFLLVGGLSNQANHQVHGIVCFGEISLANLQCKLTLYFQLHSVSWCGNIVYKDKKAITILGNLPSKNVSLL